MKNTKYRHDVAFTRTICTKLLGALGTPLSLHAAELLKNGDDASVVNLPFPVFPDDGDWRTFLRDYQAVELVSKLDCLNLGVDTQQVAIEKFLESEKICYTTNQRFVRPDSVSFPDTDVRSVFHSARRKIGRILGNFSWDEAGPLMAFGPGATIGLQRKYRHAIYKFGFLKPTVTGECATFADALIGASPQWSKTVSRLGEAEGGLSIVRGSRVTTVPKNAKTDRVIAIEPMMNMFVQKGIGGVLRRRLKAVGVNLDSQLRNQDAAKRGSLGGLATIDLKAASDSISRSLVEWLLPNDWVLAMKVCRSKVCVLPNGEEIFLQKFSSMGNGFTFELESLIFWALLNESTRFLGESTRDNCVYGDDLICPVSVVDLLLRTLSFAGFTPNMEKSFWEGPFRESCGKHFFLGHEVTPMYVRKHVNTTERKLWLANSIRRLAHRLVGYGYGCCESLKDLYDYVVSKLDRRVARLSIPEGFGDGGLVRDFDESRPRSHRVSGNKPGPFEGFVYHHMRREYSSFVPCDQPSLTLALFQLERRANYAGVSVYPYKGRCCVTVVGELPLEVTTERWRDRFVKSVATQWVDLGPWVAGFSPATH
jgi:hypothetical protein